MPNTPDSKGLLSKTIIDALKAAIPTPETIVDEAVQKNLLYGLGNQCIDLKQTPLSQYPARNGYFMGSGIPDAPNTKQSDWWLTEQFIHNGHYRWQVIYPVNHYSPIYARYMHYDEWSPWVKISDALCNQGQMAETFVGWYNRQKKQAIYDVMKAAALHPSGNNIVEATLVSNAVGIVHVDGQLRAPGYNWAIPAVNINPATGAVSMLCRAVNRNEDKAIILQFYGPGFSGQTLYADCFIRFIRNL